MVMNAKVGYIYFHDVKSGMFYSTRESKVEYNISSFTEWKYLYYRTNEKHSLFVLYSIKNTILSFIMID